MQKQKAFTLVELLVVIAIIGLLASVVLVALNAARGKARDARAQSDLKQIQAAMELYYDADGVYPDLPHAAGGDYIPEGDTRLAPYLAVTPHWAGATGWEYWWTDGGWNGTKYCVIVNLKQAETWFYASYNGRGEISAPVGPYKCPNF